MSAFFLFDNIEVRDADKLAKYAENVAPIVARFGGQYRVLGGPTRIVEGQWRPTYPVMIEFPSLEQAEAWYRSDEYRPWKQLRLSAVSCNGVLIEGMSDQ